MAVTDYRIPDDKIPTTFVSFRAQVALEVFGVKGEYSELSTETSKYICLFVCLFVYLSVHLSVCLSLYLSVLYCCSLL